MRIAIVVARVLLGAVFLLHGSNVFLQFFALPPPPPGAAGTFVAGLAGSAYFFPFLGLSEAVCGVLLVAGRFVPLALVMLAPIVLHVLAFHVFLAPSGLLLALALVGLTAFVAIAYRDSFREVLRKDAKPSGQRGAPSRHMIPPPPRDSRPADMREPIEA